MVGLIWRSEILFVYSRKIKSYGKPMFIESVTYRYRGHSKSDRNLYRTSDEIEFWKEEKDPLKRFIGKLTEENIEVSPLYAGMFALLFVGLVRHML